MAFLRAVLLRINTLNAGVGRLFRYMILPLILVVCWEVFMRYAIGRPTAWAQELSGMIFAAYFLMGGAYTLQHNAHVNVDVLHSRLSPKGRAIVDLITWSMFYLFCGVLFYKSIDFAWSSVMILETSNTVWEPYIWPVKLVLPISALLILLQGLVKTISDISIVVTGKPLLPETEKTPEPEAKP